MLSVLRGSCQHGTSSIVVICGPAGIGKTALLAEVCEHATRMKIRVGWSKCDPIEQVWPGAPVIAALRAGQDPLTTADQYEQIAGAVSEPLLLADRIASRLEDLAAVHPLLVAIDDLQWADRVSRFLLRSLLSRLADLPVVWMFAGRDDPVGIDPAGHDIIRREYLRLAPLTTQDLAAMARDRLGRVPDERTRRYLDATGGNPFLAAQVIDSLARSAAGGEPGTAAGEFTTAMARRLADLSSSARELVELVAAADRPLPVRDAFALMPSLGNCDGADGLAGAVGSGLITISADALAFRHDLVRETVYAILAGDRARQLHARLAEYHLSVLGEPLVAASHARAAARTGDLASALILVSAAETLASTSAEDAGELAALAFGTVLPAQPEWLALSRRCLSVLCRAQHAAQAITVADQILARVDDANLAAQVETEAARALWLSGRVHGLISRIEKTLRSSDLDAAVTVRLRAAYALARTRTLPGEPAAREAAGAVEQARDSGDREALTRSCRAQNRAAATGRCGRAGTGCSTRSVPPPAMTPSPPPASTSPKRTPPVTPAWPASKASPSTCADWANKTSTSSPRPCRFSTAARGRSCAPSAPNPADAPCSPPAAAPKHSRNSTGPGTNTTTWEPGPSAARCSASCARPAPAASNGPSQPPPRRPDGLPGAEPLVRLHRVALGQCKQREVPHRMMPDARCRRLQHNLRDLGSLQRAGLVSGVDLECAERDDRGRVEGSGNEMGLLSTKSAFERESRLGEVPHLQHLPPTCCLEDAQRPVLPVTLGGDHPGVDSLKGVLVPIGCGENP